MNNPFWRRATAFALALVLTLAAAPGARAAQTRFRLIELKGTDVTLDQTAFQYTGEEIRPNVTVQVKNKVLTPDKDYTLAYANNIEVGTGKVIVTGIATASENFGYTGTVEIPFQITAKAPAYTLVELKGTDVTIDGTEFAYTGSPIEPAITVTVEDKVLTAGKDYSVAYRNNVQPGTATVTVSGIATASETLGYTGTVEISFTILPQVTEPALTEIKGTDVTLSATEFTYTGSYIEPEVTVTVNGTTLTAGRDYTLAYHSNIGIGTANVTVTGLEEAGYTGQVHVPFTIVQDASTPEYQLTELKEEHVSLEGTEFPYTGKAVEPKVSVTVDGRSLTLGQDYSLNYVNNVNVGTGTAIIQGIATASEEMGYTGEVRVNFSIVELQKPDATEPEGTEPEGTEPETTEPETTEPETTEPETTEPETVTYKITKGDKSTWYQESIKSLSFTSDGPFQDFEGVKIDGKDLPETYYTVREGSTVVTLKNSFLKKLGIGKHTITILFADGQAEGAFKVATGLDTTNPQTSDSFPMELLLSVMGISAAAGAAMLVLRRKIFS